MIALSPGFAMPSDSHVQLQSLIDRIQAGDRGARRELLNQACSRLRQLTARILNESFAAVHQRHELDSVVHETWLRLVQAVEKTDAPTVEDFFRLAAFKVRQVLIDMVQRQRKQLARERLGFGSDSTSNASLQPADETYNPARLAAWTELHETVAALADDERAVFEMHYYLELPQAEIARILNLHPRRVSYIWVAATEKLADQLEHIGGLS
jgi:RNA polymerase sigma factor (sigma-70 family)